MTSAKSNVINLFEVLKSKGINEIVFSPGSRNAPLIITATEDPYFSTYNIPDERVAGFFALGLSLSNNRPAVICCTSGSACLNYGPAIAEAYYQQIPMIVITADRPIEWIDQGNGQTMQQNQVFTPYIKGSFSFLQEATLEDEVWYNNRVANELANLSKALPLGPVHLNLPLREPLYERGDTITKPKLIQQYCGAGQLNESDWTELIEEWKGHHKILLLCGQMTPEPALSKLVSDFADSQSVVVMTETTSNVTIRDGINCIDRTIESLTDDDLDFFLPTLLLTIGGAVVSKKIKALFRKMGDSDHWHIGATGPFYDTYQQLTKSIIVNPRSFFSNLTTTEIDDISRRKSFKEKWIHHSRDKEVKHKEFLKTVEWSDLQAFEQILKLLPSASNLHLANSTPIRYSQLFDSKLDIQYFCNRGLSGIDGSTSTAVGFANDSNEISTIVSGDMAFMYDSNAFYHRHVPANLKVIVINNGGGGIFRVIPGPDTTDQLSEQFESNQDVQLDHIAKAYGIRYFHAESKETLQIALKNLYLDESEAAILEIFTPRFRNSEVLKSYFKYLK